MEEGEDRWERCVQEKGCGAEKGYVPGKDRAGGLLGWGRWARGVWMGSAHLDIFFGLQLV